MVMKFSCFQDSKRKEIQGHGPAWFIIFLLLFVMTGPMLIQACSKEKPVEPGTVTHVHGIIPLPLQVDGREGELVIDTNMVLVNNPLFDRAVAVAENSLREVLGSSVRKSDSPVGNLNIQFILNSGLEQDAYQVEISGTGIILSASNTESAFHAAQSLRQLLRNALYNKNSGYLTVRQMTISDKPEYAWRGFHLDVSRHFFTKEYLMKLVDWLALYKFNKLHLHLSDDQGWRIQSDRFPLLTGIGAWRTFNYYDSLCMDLARTDIDYTIDPRFIRKEDGKTLYGGFYTKQEIREVISYAADNFIEVVPEIDMPGHMSAAIRAYPQLSCTDSTGWGVEFSVPICPCNGEAMNFAFGIWDEMADLFPSETVHIGCDEVDMATWSSSQACQVFMQQEGMTSVREIYEDFVLQMQEHLELKGKKVIAWDDVNSGKVDSSLVIMYWRDWEKDSPEISAENGNRVILTPAYPFYLASTNTDESLEDLYNYDPDEIYNTTVMSHVIGLQSCLWTEVVPSEKMFEQVVFPRLQALSEVCWSKGRNWYSFRVRMNSHFSNMDDQGIHYRRPGWKE